MTVVIQCAATKRPEAGHLRAADGRKVMFVADPASAPADKDTLYSRPDDPSDRDGKSWRDVLSEYNAQTSENPDALLPAWQIYANPTYSLLKERLGQDRLFVLSAGWGLISAGFLTPAYDITFNKAGNVAPFKRRSGHDGFRDFRMLPFDAAGPVVFLGGRDYVRLFCELTDGIRSERTVYYAGSEPQAPGCTKRMFGKPFTNWHYQCAKALLAQSDLQGTA